MTYQLWHPTQLTDIEKYYPNTTLDCTVYNDAFEEYTDAFEKKQLDPRIKQFKIIIVRGFLSALMPGYMSKPIKYLRNLGLHVVMAPIRSGGSVLTNASLLVNYLPCDQNYMLLCHSKGGLDLLSALKLFPGAPCFRCLKGIAFSQTTTGASAVMNELSGFIPLQSSTLCYRFKNKVMMTGIKSSFHGPAAYDLTTPGIEKNRQIYREANLSCPLVSVASWSIKPSSWVDSYHQRLNHFNPGVAHDGQFYLTDQLWADKGVQLVLGGIDHAQPGMGELGFDPGLFWEALLQMLINRL